MNVVLRRRHILRSSFNLSRIVLRHESQQQPVIFEDPHKYKAVAKPTRKKPHFVFNEKPIERLFLGEIDFDILEYPEIGTLDEVNYLFNFTKIVKKNIETILNLQEDGLISNTTRLENLGKLKLYGLRISRDDGGFNFCESEIGFIHEMLIFDQALSKIIGENEDLGNLIIMKYGSEAQKKKYLPKIANGEITTCFAHFETFPILTSPHDKTKAYGSAKGENFTLVGKKTLVYNAHLADLIIVSANTTELDENKENDEVKQTFFLIEKNTGGVHISRFSDVMSLNDDSFSEITFEKVVVPEDSILGKIHEGDEIVKKVLSLGKLNIGPICGSVLKHLSTDAILHNIKQFIFKEPMNDHKFMHRELAVLLREAYIVESMAYCLAGRLYWFKEPDLFLESLIVKVLASDALYRGLQQYLQLMGRNSFQRKYRLDKLLSDCLFHQVFDDGNDNLKFIVSREGLEHGRKHRKPPISKTAIKFASHTMKNVFDKPSYVLDEEMLQGYLHPSLEEVANLLFDEIQKFDKLVGKVLKSKEDLSAPEPIYLKLADMAMLMYATAATAGRASRSYCVGLKNSDVEVDVALSASAAFHRKFILLEVEILNELEEKNPFEHVGKEILSKKKYVPVHPLTKR